MALTTNHKPKGNMLNKRLEALRDRIRSVPDHECATLDQRQRRLKTRLSFVESRLGELPPDLRQRALVVLTKEMEEVLYRFEHISTRLLTPNHPLGAELYRKLNQELAGILEQQYVANFC